MEKPMPHIVNVLCVEKVRWKRAWIRKHDPPQALCSDASQLTQARIWDINQKRWIRPPACDVLNVGFSCKSFSLLNNKNRDGVHDAAIAEGRGCSGETARYALAYIRKVRPPVVLIENVPQLAKGYYQQESRKEVDQRSNLFVLTSQLAEMGYVCPVAMLDPRPIVEASRRRCWLPCFQAHCADVRASGDALRRYAERLLQEVPARARVVLAFGDMQLPQGPQGPGLTRLPGAGASTPSPAGKKH
jgi:hypothetical protein